MKITQTPGEKITQEMFGLFFEDINFAADGGLYAEMLENVTFEAKEGHSLPGTFYLVDDFGYAWSPVAADGEEAPRMLYVTGTPLSPENPHYLRLTTYAAGQGFANKAFDGIRLQKGASYKVSFYARCVAFEGEHFTISVQKDGQTYAQESVKVTRSIPFAPFTDLKQEFEPNFGEMGEQLKRIRNMDKAGLAKAGDWVRYDLNLTATDTVAGADFVLTLDQAGTVEFDRFSMIPESAVAGIFRKDLFDALDAMHPGFIRFPGGCIVEGFSLENRYQWKKTIGDRKDRKYNQNLWSLDDDRSKNDLDVIRPASSHYGQSYGLGYYEYFLLCELLGAKALPVIGIGVACQFRSTEMTDMDDPQFQKYIQDALDLIEFANGSADSTWGSIRARMGHPEPFGLEMLGVGNEQWETQDVHLYEISRRFEAAIHAAYPEIKIIGTAGPIVDLPTFQEAWDFYREENRKKDGFVYAVDEHYYVPCEWLYDKVTFYDEYPRDVAVFAGEYAAHTPDRENSMEAALAEAAFLTGVEKNAGVVKLASYAPLFNRIGHSQWKPDMIWFDDQQVYLTPNYYVQKLYATNVGDHTLDLGEQITDLRKENIYVSATEAGDGEIILKIANVNESAYELPLLDNSGAPIRATAKLQILESAGAYTDKDMPEPSRIREVEANIDGTVTLDPKTFTVIRFFLN